MDASSPEKMCPLELLRYPTEPPKAYPPNEKKEFAISLSMLEPHFPISHIVPDAETLSGNKWGTT